MLAAVFFQVLVQEGLQGADFQLGSGVGNGDYAPLAAGQDVGDPMALALAVVSAGVGGQAGRPCSFLGSTPKSTR